MEIEVEKKMIGHVFFNQNFVCIKRRHIYIFIHHLQGATYSYVH